MGLDEEFFPVSEPEATERRPSSAWWLVYLFVRPWVFFTHFPRMATWFTVAYSSWIVGTAEMIDRVDERWVQDEMAGRQDMAHELMVSWSSYWAVCVGGGLLAALFFYVVGGWWYRVRISFSGDPKPNADLARRVYILASMVSAFPSVALIALRTVKYATPQEATDLSPFGPDLCVLACVFWSVYVSYRGVRTVFSVVRWKARIWFLILPTAFYLVLLGAFAAIAMFEVMGSFWEPPDVSNPEVINRPGFVVQYPGNWFVDDTDEDYDPDQYFRIASSWDDVVVDFIIADESQDCAQATSYYVEAYGERLAETGREEFDSWGQHAGVGIELVGDFEDSRYRVRVFSMTTRTRSMTVVEFISLDEADRVEPGLDLIRRTFRLRK